MSDDFFKLFARAADICSRDPRHVTNRASISFDFHDRIYATLGENLKVLDVDDSLRLAARSPDGLPFMSIAAPNVSDNQGRAGRRFAAATTKAIHVYAQPSEDDDYDGPIKAPPADAPKA